MSRRLCLLALALLGLCIVTGVSAASKKPSQKASKLYASNFYSALTKTRRLSVFRQVVNAAGLKHDLSNPNLFATLFAPNNDAFWQLLGEDMKISQRELLLPANKALLAQLVKSLIVPGRRLYTPRWPDWPHKDWYPTLYPGHKIGLEMDDGGKRPWLDDFDVDGTDDDAELVHKSWVINLKVGQGVMNTVDDVPTWKGWKKAILRNVYRARRG